jgi:hypothetical protein
VAEKLYTELINANEFGKKSLEELEGAALRTRALAGIDTPVPVIFGGDK